MTAPESVLVGEPGDDRRSFGARLQKPFPAREFDELVGADAGLCFDVVEIRLKCHDSSHGQGCVYRAHGTKWLCARCLACTNRAGAVAESVCENVAVSERYEELDSLRGLAALTVFVYHIALWIPIMAAATRGDAQHAVLNIFKYTPLRIFISGPEAVVLFFVLSGFVLSLAFYKPTPVRYLPYLAKRVCRLWVPYAVAVTVAFAVCAMVSRGVAHGLVSSSFRTPLTVGEFLRHMTLVGNFDIHAADPPIWSLVHEMRISLIFPVLIFTIVRFGWLPNLLLWGFVSTSSTVLMAVTPYGQSMRYVIMFVVGALLAKHRHAVIGWMARRSGIFRAGVFVVAACAITFKWWTPFGMQFQWVRDTWCPLIGAALCIVLSLSSPAARRVLRTRVAVFLGRVSYSLYLYHAIVLFVLTKLLIDQLPYLVIAAIAVPIAVGAATVSYRYVEVPSIRWGRSLSASLSRLPSVRYGQPRMPDHQES